MPIGYYVPGGTGMNQPSSTPAQYNRGNKTPVNIKFNLPPHVSSLPVRPITLDTLNGKRKLSKPLSAADSSRNTAVADKKDIVLTHKRDDSDFHGLRRGRIWFYDSSAGVTKLDEKGNVVNIAGENLKSLTPLITPTVSAGATVTVKMNTDLKPIDPTTSLAKNEYNYGFQFLWNPTDISVGVARNMDITPSSADRLRAVSGAFPGQESLNFQIVLDRTNDFACILQELENSNEVGLNSLSKLSKFYTGVYPKQPNTPVFETQMMDLIQHGTMADLEYLFKAINGAGIGGKTWKNLLGKETADMGYLQPTLLAFEFGPPEKGTLSYVGWITNLSINHVAFTERMVPIRTNVQVSVDCFAGTSITSSS